MTNDEILGMAEQASCDWDVTLPGDREWIIRLARLIQQAQREEDAVICEHLYIFGTATQFHCAAAIRNSGGEA